MEDPSFTTLSSKRIVLRRFQEEDAEAFAQYRSDPHVARYQGWQIPYSIDKARGLIEALREATPGEPGSWFQFAVELQQTGQIIGDCALRCSRREPRQAELGFTFAKAHQRKGYASEAVQRLLQYAFTKLALNRVFAITHDENKAARRLLERAGFREEGHFLQSVRFEGEWAGELQYAQLQEEWENSTEPYRDIGYEIFSGHR